MVRIKGKCWVSQLIVVVASIGLLGNLILFLSQKHLVSNRAEAIDDTIQIDSSCTSAFGAESATGAQVDYAPVSGSIFGAVNIQNPVTGQIPISPVFFIRTDVGAYIADFQGGFQARYSAACGLGSSVKVSFFGAGVDDPNIGLTVSKLGDPYALSILIDPLNAGNALIIAGAPGGFLPALALDGFGDAVLDGTQYIFFVGVFIVLPGPLVQSFTSSATLNP